MCRLFGFRSVLNSMVHRSLVQANNSLSAQSGYHRDGWGVAYYLSDFPHVVKSAAPAHEDEIFSKVSGVVSSQTVVAHIRKATTGTLHSLNSHPFQFGRYVFAHNGKINNFAEKREELRNLIAPSLRNYILGETDSEVMFFLILSELQGRVELHRRGLPVEEMVRALAVTKARIRELCDGPTPEERSLLNTLITDGHMMVAAKSAHTLPLNFSTYKAEGCPDRDSCPYFSAECEAPTRTGHVNHLVISSEDLRGNNTWIELNEDDVVAVDWAMVLYRGTLSDGVQRVSEAKTPSAAKPSASVAPPPHSGDARLAASAQ